MTARSSRGKVLPLVIVLLALVVAAVLVLTRPEPEQHDNVGTGTLVDTAAVAVGLHEVSVSAKGRVVPATEIVLQPQVSGRVVAVSPELVPGGLVSAGEVLFRIEAADYELAVAAAGSALAEAEAALALEKGRQEVARKEWALFEDEAPGQLDPSLALREPQLRTAEARVASARARLRQATLNLARTEVQAPFNALIIAESVDTGQTVSPQTQAARLAGIDQFWVQAAVPVDELAFFDVGEAGGAEAQVRFDTGAGVVMRTGKVIRLLGDLDQAGQMARVLVKVDEPLGASDGSPLLLGSYVDVEIATRAPLAGVEISRGWVHDDDRVYLADGNRLVIRDVKIGWRRRDSVIVTAGLGDGDEVVTSAIMAAVEGMKLRRAGDGDDAATGSGVAAQ